MEKLLDKMVSSHFLFNAMSPDTHILLFNLHSILGMINRVHAQDFSAKTGRPHPSSPNLIRPTLVKPCKIAPSKNNTIGHIISHKQPNNGINAGIIQIPVCHQSNQEID